MAMPGECFWFDLCFGAACGTIILRQPLAQLFPETYTGGMNLYSVYNS